MNRVNRQGNSLGPLAVAILPCVALLAATGCATSALVAGDGSAASSSYVIHDNPILATQVSIVGVSHDYVGDLMRAHVTFKSRRHRSLRLLYKFTWYDENGMEIDAGTKPYRNLILEGKDAVSVSSVAPNPSAREFKVRLRKI